MGSHWQPSEVEKHAGTPPLLATSPSPPTPSLTQGCPMRGDAAAHRAQGPFPHAQGWVGVSAPRRPLCRLPGARRQLARQRASSGRAPGSILTCAGPGGHGRGGRAACKRRGDVKAGAGQGGGWPPPGTNSLCVASPVAGGVMESDPRGSLAGTGLGCS